MSAPTWHRSSRCSSGGCVEVASIDGLIYVRDSKNPGAPPLKFSVEEWRVFEHAMRCGELSVEALTADRLPRLEAP
jgi:hypothetical protein